MPTVEDYQAALNEANSQISYLSLRAQQLAVQIAGLAKELENLKSLSVVKEKKTRGRVI